MRKKDVLADDSVKQTGAGGGQLLVTASRRVSTGEPPAAGRPVPFSSRRSRVPFKKEPREIGRVRGGATVEVE